MIDEKKTDKSNNKIKLFLTKLVNWKVFFIIFIPAMYLNSTANCARLDFMEILLKTIFIITIYRLFRSLPSILFSNNKNKLVKILINFLRSISLVFIVMTPILIFIGKPLYEGHQKSEQMFDAQFNHSNITSFVGATFTKCSLGASTVKMGSYDHSCSSSASNFVSYFATYFAALNENPYFSKSSTAISNNSFPELGVTNFGVSGNRIIIATNVGDCSGGNSYLQTDAYYNYSNE